MRILGLDLSLRSTGYVLLEDDQVVWHGVIGSDTLREAERLQMFDKWIRDTLANRNSVYWTHHPPTDAPRPAYTPLDHVAIEGYSYGQPQAHTRAFGVGELGGVIKLAIYQIGIPIHVIATNTWKMVVCGKGGLDKRNASVEISKRYGVEFAKEDTLDAWAVAMCLRRQLLGLDKPEPKVRRRKSVPLLESIVAGNE